MSDFITKLLEILEYLSPLKIVRQWERGCLYRFGRYQRELSPGIYCIFPFFWDIKTESVVINPHTCPMQSITLDNGQILTFNLLISVEVIDLGKAFNEVHDFAESCREIGMSCAADTLGSADANRLGDPIYKTEIIDKIQQVTNKYLGRFGCYAVNLTFQNYVICRTIRLLGDLK